MTLNENNSNEASNSDAIKEMLQQLSNDLGIVEPPVKSGRPASASEHSVLWIVRAIRGVYSKLKEEIKSRDVQIKNLNDEITSLKDKTNTLEVNNTSTQPLFSELFKQKPNEHEIRVLASVTREQKDIEKRENNLILFNVPESNKDNTEDVRKDDEEKVVSILSEIEANQNCFKKIYRMKKSTKSLKPAPIVLELHNSTEKNNILKCAKRLKSSESYKNVYINPDLTIAQREVYKN